MLLGDSAVGKSSLVLRFVRGQFFEYQESTIGAAFLTQTVALNDTTVKFEIWDTAGQERYHSLAPMYYRGAAAAIVVYDITNRVRATHARSPARSLARSLRAQRRKRRCSDPTSSRRFRSVRPSLSARSSLSASPASPRSLSLSHTHTHTHTLTLTPSLTRPFFSSRALRVCNCGARVRLVCSQDTFQRAKQWVKELQRQGNPNIVIALAGNKSDLNSKRKVEPEEAESYASDNGIFFMETSAKTATNVNELFVAIARKLPKNTPQRAAGQGLVIANDTGGSGKKSGCASRCARV